MTSYEMFFGMIRDSGKTCTIETKDWGFKIILGDFWYDGCAQSTEEAVYSSIMAYHRHLGREEACRQIKDSENGIE